MANKDEKISKLVSDTEEQIGTLKDCVSDFFDIACLPSTIKEVSELLIKVCQIMDQIIIICENNNKSIKDLVKDTGKGKMDIDSPSGEKPIFHEKYLKGLKTIEKEISFRPHTENTISTEKMIRIDLPIQNSYVETYVSIMMNLYKLPDLNPDMLIFQDFTLE